MTRLWPDGTSIEVVLSSVEAPSQFTWRGQTHSVEAISKRWRIQTDWWHVPVHRDYFKVTTLTGLLVIIFHDLHSGDWYLQRLYD